MLVKLTIERGCIPVEGQPREAQFANYLADLRRYDPGAEEVARTAIRRHLDTNPQGVTAAWMACTGHGREWHPEFEPLFHALEAVAVTREDAQIEAGKFLGLLLWSELLEHPARWHFNDYKKGEEDYSVMRYWALDHICASVKTRQSEQARQHADEARAHSLEEAAAVLRNRWQRL